MIRIIIADDHPVVREGLKQLLELNSDFNILAQTETGMDTIKMTEKLLPDILLLDINLPDINGIEVLNTLKKENINTKIIMLTIHNESEYLLKAVECGCDGYVLKDAEFKLIEKAILKVYDNNFFIQPSLAPVLNAGFVKKNNINKELDSLTSREIEVLKLLGEGLFNKEIATTLNISERTVKNHISNIFKKIHVADRTQAALFAIKHNLISIK